MDHDLSQHIKNLQSKDKLPRYEKNSMIQFILIHPTLDQNAEFLNHPICKDGIHASIEYYKT
ncbi:MAG: hypothetical protein ACHQEM_13555, partial [Chitinophagales bacterium]